ncbi:MAG: 2-oxoglutarate dehydrogenase complex dihydrolipoyllysine-residue succinyltransferase [Bacteroidota bacterium]
MSIEIKVPAVGESITEVTIANWLKKDGDTVKQDEIICELESDKATFELPAPSAGVLKISAQTGDVVPVGGTLGSLEGSGSAAAAPAPSAPAAPAAQSTAPAAAASAAPAPAPAAASGQAYTMKVPAVGESIAEVTISAWHKKEGDMVNADELLYEIESDKAGFEINAEASGVLHIIAQAGTTIAVGEAVCTITSGASATAQAPAAAPTAPSEAGTAVPAASAPAASLAAEHHDSSAAGAVSPLVSRILAEKGVNPASVQGTGFGGKITKEDALKAVPGAAPVAAPAAKPAATQAASATPAPAAAASNGTAGREQKRTKMSPLRKTVARRLVAVKNETAMLTTFNEVDMKPIMDLRNKYKDKFKEKHGVGLGFMSFFARACSVALLEWPAVNAMIDGDEIVYNDFVDISIAVSAPKGLVVPVIRNAEDLSFAGIEKEVVRLATLARDNKLTIDQMTGGTFTITNGGVFGSMMSTPIINAPQSAILGMHNIVERPMVVNGEIVIRPIMYVALSYDHRIIDGRESVSFLVRVKQLLEEPTRLLLDV